MPRSPRKPDPLGKTGEAIARLLEGFDYAVDPHDFVFYELHRLIEEDRASFDDAEFRTLIDSGIRAHVEENIETRARLAGLLRTQATEGPIRTVALRIVHAIEDMTADLRNVAALVRNYPAYLLRRLETLEADAEEEQIAEAADLLFESPGDHDTAETALAVLARTRSPVTARVLAHVVSEPLLDEDLEAKAFAILKGLWPLSRHYMLYNLQGHPHEDVPFRWFQLFVEVDELTTVDLVLEELRAHGDSPGYREDLVALLDALQGSRDPETEDKILGAINSPMTNPAVMPLLQAFLQDYRPPNIEGATPWTRNSTALDLNRRYIEAADLFDRGMKTEAAQALDRILDADPDYPFALMLKRM